MKLPLYQVDAFTDQPFRGNPAAVCLLETWPHDERLAAIAAENNLSETAFLVADGQDWQLRWFTPTIEVALCGHATLASAWVLRFRGVAAPYRFHTKSGLLTVTSEGQWLTMDFPALPPHPAEPEPGLLEALGATPEAFFHIRSVGPVHYHLAVFAHEDQIAALRPDTARMVRDHGANVICTAPGSTVDFVSRFFAPASGIPEDPVTGSAHCTLAPWWAEQLGRTDLLGRQISARGGSVRCRVVGDRVLLSGRCAPYLEGVIHLPD